MTDGGYGKRTPIEEWSRKGRNIKGVRAMRLVSERGGLVGALVCAAGDEVLAIADSGIVIRCPVEDIRTTGRDTMGVSLMGLGEGQSVVAVARATEREDDDEEEDEQSSDSADTSATGAGDIAESGETPHAVSGEGSLTEDTGPGSVSADDAAEDS